MLAIDEATTEPQFEAQVRNWLRLEMPAANERRDIVTFLIDAVDLSKENLIELFVEIMRGEVPHEAEMPYVAYLLTLDLPDTVLDILVQVFDPEYYDMVSGLLWCIDEDHIALGIRNISKIFAGIELDRTALELLEAKAQDKGLVQLIDYLTYELRADQSTYAVVPEWIIPGVRTHKQLVRAVQLPKIDKWRSTSAELDARYVASLVEEDRDIEDVYQQLVVAFDGYTVAQREEMISNLIKQNSLMMLQLDGELFRVFGPCLPMGPAYELRLHSSDPCNMYGGCRSYTCYENHNINEDTVEALFERPVENAELTELEWFTGRCGNEECRLLIRKKCHAIRMPVPGEGGWLGCYCSFSCLRDVATDRNAEEGSQTLVSDVLTNLIAGFEGQYLMHGIYDRDD